MKPNGNQAAENLVWDIHIFVEILEIGLHLVESCLVFWAQLFRTGLDVLVECLVPGVVGNCVEIFNGRFIVGTRILYFCLEVALDVGDAFGELANALDPVMIIWK